MPPGVAGAAARLIRGHPRQRAAVTWEGVGEQMRGLMRRTAVVASAPVVLLAPAVSPQLRRTLRTPRPAVLPGRSITSSPNPRAGNGALNAFPALRVRMHGRWLAGEGVRAGGDARRAVERQQLAHPVHPSPGRSSSSAPSAVACLAAVSEGE